MKQFAKGIFIFLLPILAVFFVLEFLVRDSNSLYRDKWDGYISKSDSINVLVLGNSHAMNAIDTREFELFTYNMAFGAQSFYFDKEITLKNINNMPNLKYVLISLDYHTLYYEHNESRDVFYHYYYDIDYEDKTYYLEDISWVNTLGFKQTIREHIPRPKTNTYHGFDFSYDTTNWSVMNVLSGKKRVEQLEASFNNENDIINNLNNFIQILKSNNVTPILITLPCHEYFKQHLNKGVVKKNKLAIKQICNLYEIEYWNFMDNNYPDSLYYNVDHLNKHGAKKISKELNNMIKRYIKKNSSNL